jgi:predicted N-formylglutamate amidohydrolase
MEALIDELRSLKDQADPPSAKLLGAILAVAVRVDERYAAHSIGVEMLASALAAQEHLDAQRLHDDFMRLVNGHFRSPKHIPSALKDIAAAIKIAASHKRSR